MASTIQAKASINGSKQFQDDLKKMTARSKALDAEMKEMTNRFEKDGKAMGDDAKQRELSSKAIQAQKEKIALLTKELQRLEKEGNGETAQAYKLREQIAKANTELTNMQHSSDKAADGQKNLTAAMMKGSLGATAITTALKGAVTIMKSIVSAAGNAAKAVWNLGVESGQWADSLITLSNQTGVDTDTLQEWTYAARFVDTEVSTMTKGMTKLTKAYAKGTASKKKSVKLTKGVVVSLQKENGEIKSQSEFYLDTIDALHGMTNVAQRNAAAQKIFGKSYTDMLPLIETGTAALRQYGQEARDMGVIISSDNVNALGAFDDQMQKFDASLDAIKTNLAVAFLPTLEVVAERMTGFMSTVSSAISDGLQEEDIDTIVDAFFGMFDPAMSDDGRHSMNAIEFIGKLITKFLEQLGVNKEKILGLGMTVVGYIWNGIREGLGILWSNFIDSFVNFNVQDTAISQAFAGYANNMLDNFKTGWGDWWAYEIPYFVEKAVLFGKGIITSIGSGITNGWDAAVKFFDTVGTNIFTTVGGWVTTVFESGKTFIASFVGGIVSEWSQKIQTIKGIGTELSEKFTGWVESAKTWGKDLIANFIGGIKQKWTDLKQSISGVGQAIKNRLGFSEPKEGPLSDFHTYAPDMIDLFVKGIKDNAWRVDSALASTFGVLPTANPAMGGGSTTNVGGVTIVVNGAAGQDVNALADIVMQKMQNAVTRREAVFA